MFTINCYTEQYSKLELALHIEHKQSLDFMRFIQDKYKREICMDLVSQRNLE